MPDTAVYASSDHVPPFVVETLTSKSLHFSFSATQSSMRLDDPDALELDYTRVMMGFLLFIPRPKRLAMIGLGGGSLPKFCHRHLPGSRIEVVEINPHVIALRDQFHVPPDSARFRVLQADGARFARERSGAIDVLIVDGFDDVGQSPQLASRRFYDDCRESLAEGGVMVVNLHGKREGAAPCVERIRRSFGERLLVVDSQEDCNTIVFAFKDASSLARRPGEWGRPPRLRKHAAESLRSALASVEHAWQEFKSTRQALPSESNRPAALE
jgi:spermidine synthase